uniref:Uncharacterized protein n=1 Tax=Salix viminalis TaxID=40686 RepID=A0A6N2NGY1_SALVM
MASFSVEDFSGLAPTLLEEGWDDIPTLKIMNSEDTDAMNMTQQQYLEFASRFSFDQNMLFNIHWLLHCQLLEHEALEIRSYLHDRALLQYGEKLEASGKCLPELLSLSAGDLSSHFGMKRDHMARFMDRTSACEDPWLKSYAPLTARKMNSAVSRNNSNFKSYASVSSKKMQTSSGMNSDKSLEQSLADFKLKDGYIFKGIAAAGPAEPRACGCVQPPPVVTKLTPEYKIGMEHLVNTKTPPMKAVQLWRDKPAVKGFWPRYWGGFVLFDRSMEFPFGGGQLLKDKIISGFIFNPELLQITSVQKLWELIKTSKEKGGLFIVGRDKSGIAYQFIERNFDDWAPVAENQQQSKEETIKISQQIDSNMAIVSFTGLIKHRYWRARYSLQGSGDLVLEETRLPICRFPHCHKVCKNSAKLPSLLNQD